MAIAMIFDSPGVTQDRSDQVMEMLRQRGVSMPVEGQLIHLAGPYNGGWRTVDVWESQEAADRFFRDYLSAAFMATGGIPNSGAPQVFPVHDLYM